MCGLRVGDRVVIPSTAVASVPTVVGYLLNVTTLTPMVSAGTAFWRTRRKRTFQWSSGGRARIPSNVGLVKLQDVTDAQQLSDIFLLLILGLR